MSARLCIALALLVLGGCRELYEEVPPERALAFTGAVPLRLLKPSGELHLGRGSAFSAQETVHLAVPSGSGLGFSASICCTEILLFR